MRRWSFRHAYSPARGIFATCRHADIVRVRRGPFVLVMMLGIAALCIGAAAARGSRQAAGTVYYLSSSGSDSASGTSPANAWRTINRLNSQILKPGDTVLFQGGATFSGEVYVSPSENGTSAQPITFDSYGTGRATISGGTGSSAFVYDSGGIVIQDLVLKGSGASTNTSDGLGFYNDLAGNVKRSFVRITNVSVSGFGHYGISIGGWNGSSGFQDVAVTYSDLHDNGRGGLVTYGPAFQPGSPAYANANVYVGHIAAYDNLGDPKYTANSGNGVVLGSVATGTIERSVSHDNGALCHASACGAGIWAYDSTGITIQYNESYDNRTGSTTDGDGFDLDQNTSNSWLQYNYSHGNDGSGYLLYTGQSNSSWSGNTVRYNISESDGRKNGYASIFGGGRISNSSVYNNTVYLVPAASGTPSAVRFLSVSSSVTVRNNILHVVGGLPMVMAPSVPSSSLAFQQNDYFSPSGQFKVTWGSTTYTTPASWRTATGQEMLAGVAKGVTTDPRLVSPGGGGTIGNADNLASLTAYRLQTTSPLRDIGLNLQSLFGVIMGGHDYYGMPAPVGLGPEVGAAELAVG